MTWGVLASSGSESTRIAALLSVPEVDDPGDVERIVHTGSDASLAALASQVGPSVPILHAPVGASDLALMFGPRDLRDRVVHGAPYPMDLIAATSESEHRMVASHVLASANGRLPSPLARSRSIELVRDGRLTSVSGTVVVGVNAQHVHGANLAPKAAVMDGRFDLQVIGGSVPERLLVARRMRRGLHLAHRAVFRRSAVTASVELPPGWRMTCDGKPVGGRHWDLEVVPAACTLWV